MQKKTVMFIVGSIILLAIGALIDGVFHRVQPAQAEAHHSISSQSNISTQKQ